MKCDIGICKDAYASVVLSNVSEQLCKTNLSDDGQGSDDADIFSVLEPTHALG